MIDHFFTLKTTSERDIHILDQRRLPFEKVILKVENLDHMIWMIKDMALRGAGLIGVAAGYGAYLAALEATKTPETFEQQLAFSLTKLEAARPTAVNLSYAVQRQKKVFKTLSESNKSSLSFEKLLGDMWEEAEKMRSEDIDACQKIGVYGCQIIENLYLKNPHRPVQVLTHCNAGKLAFIEWGTALAPVYAAHKKNIPVHVWVEETRPRNQGSLLTSWELSQAGVAHTIITDNAGGYVLQKKMVDVCFVGCDRASVSGDVCNKIGTYKTALACFDNQVPFYAAFPKSTIDASLSDPMQQIPIEERDPKEVSHFSYSSEGKSIDVPLANPTASFKNYGFDITPSRLVSATITEDGIQILN